MSTRIGKVEFVVGMDGTVALAEARVLGNRIGAALSEAINNRMRGNLFGSGFDREFEAAGARLGERLANSMGATFRGRFQKALTGTEQVLRRAIDAGPLREFNEVAERGVYVIYEQGKAFEDTTRKARPFRDALDGIGERLKSFGAEGMRGAENFSSRFSAAIDRANVRTREFNRGIRDRVIGSLTLLRDSIRRNAGPMRSFGERWKSLSANTRQWTLIVGVVISAMQELAVLGSAAGAGLFVFAGAATGAAVGLIALVSAFGPFVGDLDKVPASLLASRNAFDAFRGSLTEVRRALSEAVFRDTVGVWDSLKSTVDALRPSFTVLGDSIRNVLVGFAESVAPTTTVFANLQGLIEKSGPIFESVMKIAGKFGRTLLAAFNNPRFQKSIEQLLGYLDLLFTRFEEFVNSPGFDEWLENAEKVFGSFGSLLDTTFRVLNDLVTPDSVKRLTDFLGNIERFIAGPGKDVLEFFGELNLFGLLAQLFADFGEALAPLGPPLIEVAEGLRDIISSGIEQLAPIIEGVAEALAPFVTELGNFMKENPDAIASAITGLAAAFVVFKGAQGIAGASSLMQGFVGTMNTATKKAPGWKTGIAGALSGIVATLPGTLDGEVAGTDVVSGMAGAIAAGAIFGGPIGAAIGAIGSLVTSMLVDMFDTKHGAWNIGAEQIGTFFMNEIEPRFRTGWEQIQAFFTNVIPTLFSIIQLGFVTGWTMVTTWFQQNVLSPIQAAWFQIVTFFTVGIPNLFSIIQLGFVTGWTMVTDWFYANVGSKFEAGWNQIVTFFTVSIPGFFATIGQNFRNGWNTITSFWNTSLQGLRVGWDGFWGGLGNAIGNAANIVKSQINKVIGIVNGLIGNVNKVTGGFGLPAIPSVPRLARGGVAWSSMIANIGEEGPEMVVPLRRPLGMVDPQVREVAAFAQGKLTPEGGTTNNFDITVNEAGDARRTAIEVADEVANSVAG